MNSVILNPENYTEKYLEFLNQCFPGWGDKSNYKWVFDRQIGKHKSDILLLTNESDEVIAGSGITYRNIKTSSNKLRSIGTFTGSWTLPKARGRGCFTQIIQEFIKLCNSKGVDYLTAFVTESNASYRRFKSIGSETLQADNVFSDIKKLFNVENKEVKQFQIENKSIYKDYYDFVEKNSGYFYKEEEFINQYINRPLDTYGISLDESKYVIEENSTTLRVLYMNKFDLNDLKVLSNWSKIKKNKKIMFFSTNKKDIKASSDNHFIIVPSFFTINKINNELDEIEDFKNFNIALADKM